MEYSIVIFAVIIVLIIIMLFYYGREYATDLFYLDQIAMKSMDPTYMKYMGRERDWRGNSMKDYYVENDMNSKNYASRQYLEKDDGFKNQANMCPKPMSHYVKSGCAIN
jgi:hypothetical protein